MLKHKKADSFYKTYERRGPGQTSTTYCPGCGHGVAHKLIAEAIDDLGIQDRTVFHSPVGCSVFAYYYFDVGNIQCAHGRAPAVATGVSRALDDAVVISYQGDGDLAGIGMGAIMHAANRGEHMAVFFINNAIYGMTGGQMAPTTLLGQKTLTTPDGRTAGREGFPISMCELISTLNAPVYIERVSLGDPGRVMKARKAIRTALQNQIERKGFSFVEILSPCPINWKMSSMDSRKWLMENLEPVFPVKNFRSLEAPTAPWKRPAAYSDEQLLGLLAGAGGLDLAPRTEELDDQYVKLAGFGGQGVMSAGVLLANCATAEGRNATWLPSYGPEMRGGTAYASVIISGELIGSPVVDHPNWLLAMNAPSLAAFESSVAPGGTIVVNSSLIEAKVGRKDVRAVYVPVTEMATILGLPAAASVMLAAVYALESGAVEIETIKKAIPLSLKKKALAEANVKAVETVAEWWENNREG